MPSASTLHGTDDLLRALRWRSSVFHVGQYCGHWSASTAGRGQASFHLVLRGACDLHRPGEPALRLQAGDAVFFASDQPHQLGPAGAPVASCQPAVMQPSWPAEAGGTALACGFLGHDGAVSAWLLRALPALTVLRHDDRNAQAQAARSLLELLLQEADTLGPEGVDRPGPAVTRLADLLVLYLLRQAGQTAPRGPWALAAQPDLAPLLDALLADPAAPWTAERMAARLHLSRAAFFRRFQQACGQAPAQFVLHLRMVLACESLREGDSVERAAARSGFESPSAFHRAFVRVMGEPPGRYARLRP